MTYAGIRRKVFVSFYRDDRFEVQEFVKKWAYEEGIFIPKMVGVFDDQQLINSNDPEYVMRMIREKYIGDSTVTMVMVGTCTHSRRYVDWEIKASLRQGQDGLPNGLFGVVLPSCGKGALLPPRLEANWEPNNRDCYARYWEAPSSPQQMASYIEDAYGARWRRAHLIVNSHDMMKYNHACRVCGVVHPA